MSRRAAIALAAAVASLWAAALVVASTVPHARLPGAPIVTPAIAPRPHARGTRVCASGPGTAVTALASDTPDLETLARRAFAFDRLAERAGAAPALPQRMGADLAAAPPATCVDLP